MATVAASIIIPDPAEEQLQAGEHIVAGNPLRSAGRLFVGLLGLMIAVPSVADLYATEKLKIYGDFRFRLEQDWDSHRSNGSQRDDRLRARMRLRLGLAFKATDNIELGARLRSGSDDSQQSPHITIFDFDDNPTGDADFNFDKWYLKASSGNLSVWIGRNSLSIWKPNEEFWDDDITPMGASVGYDFKLSDKNKLSITGGLHSLPAGMRGFCGDMVHGQAVFQNTGDSVGFTVAAGVYDISKGSANDSDCDLLLRDNGRRDWTLWVGNLQVRFKAGNRPLKIGIDYMHNSKSYALTEPGITLANQNEKDGWDAYIVYGSSKKKHDWLLGYWYANIEQLAVNSSFNQDDWVRWGSATQTRATDTKGHEFRAAWGLGGGMNLVARLYIVDAITSGEDGKRFRLDFNYKF